MAAIRPQWNDMEETYIILVNGKLTVEIAPNATTHI